MNGRSTGRLAALALAAGAVSLSAVVAVAAGASRGGFRGLTDLAVVSGRVWVGDSRGMVTPIDPYNLHRRGRSISAGAYVFSVASGFGSLWVASDDGVVRRIDPRRGVVVNEIARDNWRPIELVATDRAVWVRDSQHDRVYRIDPASNRPSRVAGIDGRPFALGAAEHSVWVMMAPRATTTGPAGPRTIARVGSRGSILPTPRIPVGCDGQLEASGTVLWVTNVCAGTLTPYDTRTGKRLGTPIRAGHEPVAVKIVGNNIWVSYSGGTVVRVDSSTRKVLARIQVPGPSAISTRAGTVWVVSGARAVARIASTTNRMIGHPVGLPPF